MAENMKRRIPKWDVAAELHVETVGHESSLPAKVDDPCMETVGHESSLPAKVDDPCMETVGHESSLPAEVNDPCMETVGHESFLPAKVDDPCMETVEHEFFLPAKVDDPCMETVGHESSLPAKVYDPCMETVGHEISLPAKVDDPCMETVGHESSLLAKVDDPCMDLTEVNSINPILSMNVDGSEINQSANQSGEERNYNIVLPDDIGEKTLYLKQVDLEGDCNDDFKQHWESASQDRTMAEHTENQDKSHEAAYDMSPGFQERDQWTRNVSPVDDPSRSHRKRSRSLSHDSRSKSWSRSRSKSPSYVSKQGFDRWTDKRRMRGMTAACRDFAAGNCRRGTECSYLHEGGYLRQIDRHHDDGLTDGRGSRLERERQEYGSKESLTDTREKDNYSREKLSGRHEEHHEDGRANNVQHQSYRSNDRCFDFMKGRCFRGEACRYIHHDASSDGGWSVREESRGRVHDRSSGSASFSRRPEHQKLSDIPCKYFLRGYCLHGEGCKFYHQPGPLNIPVERSLNGSRQHSFVSGGPAANITSTNAHKETQPSEQHTTISVVSEKLSANNSLPTTPIAGQNAENRVRSQSSSHLFHAQNLGQNSSIQQFVSPLPSKGQMLQVMPSHHQNGKNQFADSRSFNTNIQNQSVNSSFNQLNPQNLDPRGQVQQNLSILSHSGNNLNHNGQIQLNGQNHLFVGSQPSSNPQILNSDDKNCQLTMKNIKTQLGQGADSSEVKPPQFNSDNSITHKLVTIEQAAKITDLSASLAQFFGTPRPFLNPSSIGSFVTTAAPLPTEVEASQANLSHSTPKHNEQIHVIDIKQVDDSSYRKVEKIEPHAVNKEQHGDAEDRKDGDIKKSKEAKEIRMFKCALIEFVKDILKPKWKEGQLSKEAYKTIVKKVVEKVCGSLQGPSIPQTQEKIDLYLLNCKAKLSKLVQAYVEKFVNS